MKAKVSTIVKKKRKYGNSFPFMADTVNYVRQLEGREGTPVTIEDIIYALIGMKIARSTKLLKLLSTTAQGSEEFMELKKSLEDTELDLANYYWIKENYQDYLEL